MAARRPLWCPCGRRRNLATPTVCRHPRGNFVRGGVFSTCPGNLFVRRARTTLPLLRTDSVGGIASSGKESQRHQARPATLVCMERGVSARRVDQRLPRSPIDRQFDGNRGLRVTLTSGTRVNFPCRKIARSFLLLSSRSEVSAVAISFLDFW